MMILGNRPEKHFTPLPFSKGYHKLLMTVGILTSLLFFCSMTLADTLSDLSKRHQSLVKAGKNAEAIAILEKLLVLQRKKYADAPNHIEIGLSLYNLAKLHHAKKEYKKAEPLYLKSATIISNTVGADHFYIALLSDQIATFYQDQKRYKEAEPFLQKALVIIKRNKGKHHPSVGNILSKLAALYEYQKHYSRAESTYRQSIALYENILNSPQKQSKNTDLQQQKASRKTHSNLAATLANLGGLYQNQKRYKEAEPLFLRSVTQFEKAFGANHIALSTPLNRLRTILWKQKRFADAKQPMKRLLKIHKNASKPNHYFIAGLQLDLGVLYQTLAQYGRSEKYYLLSLKGYEKLLGKDHQVISTVLDRLTGLYFKQRLYAMAVPVLNRKLSIDQKHLGKKHFKIAENLNTLALIYKNQGRLTEAEPLYTRCLQIYESEYPKETQRISSALNNLANLYSLQKLYEKAEPLLLRSLQIDEKVYGKKHLKVAKTLNNLGNLYRLQYRYTKAEQFYTRSLQIFEEFLDPDNIMLAVTLDNFASISLSQKKYKKAETMRLRALAILQKKLGSDHEDVGISLGNLGVLYDNQGLYKKAEYYYKKSLQVSTKALGADHPSNTIRLTNLKKLYEQHKKYDKAAAINRLLKQMPEKGTRHTPLFFITNRAIEQTKPRLTFNAQRDQKIHLGKAVMQIPNQELKKLAQRQADGAGLSDRNTQGTLTTADKLQIKRLKTFDRFRPFKDRLNQTLKRAGLYKNQILIFVHGYNTDFDEALKRTAQLAFDLNFDGALIPFIWPSKGSLTGYFYDRKSAFDAQKHLVSLLDTLSITMPNTKIHFISHSMGNVVLLGALEKIAQRKTSGTESLDLKHNLGEVILAHPDVDKQAFSRYAKAIKPLVSGITLYTNANDLALKVSGWVRLDKRAGSEVLLVEGIDTIDTTGMGTGSSLTSLWKSIKGGFNHDVFVRNPILFGELTRLLRSGLRPVHERSAHFSPVKTKKGRYWKFNPDNAPSP